MNIKKRLNNFINTSIGISALFIVLGVLFFFFPETFLDAIRWFIVALSGIAGICLIASDFSRKNYSPMFSTATSGALMLIIAVVFAIYPNIMNIFPVVIGALFVLSAISSLRFATSLRGTSSGALSIIAAVLSMICGLLLIFNPWGGQISLMIFAGVMMIIYGITNIIEMVVLKHNLKDISKSVKEMLKATEE